MRITATLCAALFSFAGARALAQDVPKPSPELAQMKYFEGAWMCSGNAPESPFGPAHKTRTSMVIKRDLDGFWYSGTVTEMKTAASPHPLKGKAHVGFDPAAKQYLMVWVDNSGSWATQTSPGWEGDTIVWSGEQKVMGEKASARDTFVRKSANELTHKFELEVKGQWNTIVEETCKKAVTAKK